MMIYVIARNMEHFTNWAREQKVNPRTVKLIFNFRDASYIPRECGYVSLTPMTDVREEERIRQLLRSKDCYELSHNINEWPLTEFAHG